MKRELIVGLSLLIAANLHAQLTYLSDGRSVTAAGTVTDVNGNVLNSYSQTNMPSSAFAAFNGGAGSGYGGVSSSGGQNSLLSSDAITSSGGLDFFLGTGAYGSGFAANAQAVSTFEVSFSVQQPLTYNFSAFQDIESSGGLITFELTSASQGNIFDSATQSTYGNNSLTYSGVLDSGDYTLSAEESFYGSSFGNSYDSGALNYNMVLAIPEPAAIGPFVGLTCLGYVALKRKLAKTRQ